MSTATAVGIMCGTLDVYYFLSPIPGLDPSGYRQSVDRREAEEEKALLGAMMSEEERYKDCDRFHFSCPKCGRDIIFDNLSSELVSAFVRHGTLVVILLFFLIFIYSYLYYIY